MTNNIFRPELFSVLKQGYGKQQFSKDLFSGIIVGIVALPLAVAFAVASGVSPEKGLITAVIAGFIISFLGGSRVQIGGPTGAYIVIVSGIVAAYGIDGLIISTIMAGILLVIFGLLRLGSLLKFIPHPLIVGFTSGIALVIFSTQIKDALGLQIENIPSQFIGKWAVYLANLDTINPIAAAITAGTVLISLGFNKITNKIPGSFVAIILMTAIVALFRLPVTTIETTFGNIPSSFSVTVPHIDWSNLQHYFAPALTIALLGAIESLLSAVVADGMIGTNHKSNTELIAQGCANVVTPLFGGIPATGAIARTATNIKNGGRTPIAGMIHAVTLLLIMLFLGKWAKLIPMSCLAGILILVSYNMSEWRSFRSILKGQAFDVIILLTTFFLTVLVDLTVAIQVGVVLSAILFMKRMADNGQAILLDKENNQVEDYGYFPKGIEIYEISGPFFFGAAKHYSQVLKEQSSSAQVLIIRMRNVPFIDATGIHNFREAIKSLRLNNKHIVLSGVQPSVRKELDRSGITSLIGEDAVFDHFDGASAKAKELVCD
jgi:SulP family sulfate permease